MGRRDIPEINAGSMADIAFLLLIFFLVTTTMDTPTGLMRQLPPKMDEVEPPPPVKERNIFSILVNANNELLVEGEMMELKNLRERAKEFIIGRQNVPNDERFPEFKPTDIEFYGKGYPVSKQIISLQNDKGTSYGTYIQVQNELVAAYNEIRNEEAMRKFGVTFDRLEELKKEGDDLSARRVDAIKDVYPQRISEAEPKQVGKIPQ